MLSGKFKCIESVSQKVMIVGRIYSFQNGVFFHESGIKSTGTESVEQFNKTNKGCYKIGALTEEITEKEFKKYLDKEETKIEKEIINACLGQGICKFTTEFVVMKKGNNHKVITYSEDFEEASEYGESIGTLKAEGWEKIFTGYEDDIWEIREIEEN